MPNSYVPASAEGLPSVNRRRLLLGLAATSTAAATVTGTVAIAAAAPVQENPELIRLGDELPAIGEAYLSAARRIIAVEKEWKPQWPTAPEELIASHGWGSVEYFGGGSSGTRMISALQLRHRMDLARRALRSKATKKVWHKYKTQDEWQVELEQANHLHGIAVAFEAERERVKLGADYESCWQACHDTISPLASHITAIMAEPDHTATGMLIKAEALALWGETRRRDRLLGVVEGDGYDWPGQMAASIIRHAGKGVA